MRDGQCSRSAPAFVEHSSRAAFKDPGAGDPKGAFSGFYRERSADGERRRERERAGGRAGERRAEGEGEGRETRTKGIGCVHAHRGAGGKISLKSGGGALSREGHSRAGPSENSLSKCLGTLNEPATLLLPFPRSPSSWLALAFLNGRPSAPRLIPLRLTTSADVRRRGRATRSSKWQPLSSAVSIGPSRGALAPALARPVRIERGAPNGCRRAGAESTRASGRC